MHIDKGIDLSTVKGSGENGRIIKKDVESFTAPAATAPASAPAPAEKKETSVFRTSSFSYWRGVKRGSEEFSNA